MMADVTVVTHLAFPGLDIILHLISAPDYKVFFMCHFFQVCCYLHLLSAPQTELMSLSEQIVLLSQVSPVMSLEPRFSIMLARMDLKHLPRSFMKP